MSATGPWEENAAFWDAQMGDAGNEFHLRLVRPEVERPLGAVARQSVLDIACGNGLDWNGLPELPPVLVARLRATGGRPG